jgi:hypothetical protein
MKHAGGCLCGAVRYESSADPVDAGYCHCRMCQLTSGSSVLPWASFAVEGFSYTQGEPKVYRSSANGQREFCGNCGSQIAFRGTDSRGLVEINTGTLDAPERVMPQYHIWCDSRVPWFDIDDDLPRYPKSAPKNG